MKVFVLSSDRKPLDPTTPGRARRLLTSGRAAVFRRFPFVIILKNRTAETSVTHTHRLKFDPGSKVTGVAIQNEQGEVVYAAEIEHRGLTIKKGLDSRRGVRRGRRNRHCRYRQPRFDNRKKCKGWIAPSLNSRVENTITSANRLRKYCPIASLSMELVKFDTQLMANPEISGVEYQQGELQGYEVREYLLEKWDRKCAYCGAKDVPLQVEHINPRSRHGSKRVSNLTLACQTCNQEKGNQTAAEFGHPEIQAQAQQPLRDVAVVNSTRWALFERLKQTGLPLECGTGGRTKYNRTRLGLAKSHWIDAACVGVSGEEVKVASTLQALHIKAMGHGSRQMCKMDRFGFPRTKAKSARVVKGFRTGDLVQATLPMGKNIGTHQGRVAVRSSGSFNIQKADSVAQGISWKYCHLLQHSDGYAYSFTKGEGASSRR